MTSRLGEQVQVGRAYLSTPTLTALVQVQVQVLKGDVRISMTLQEDSYSCFEYGSCSSTMSTLMINSVRDGVHDLHDFDVMKQGSATSFHSGRWAATKNHGLQS